MKRSTEVLTEDQIKIMRRIGRDEKARSTTIGLTEIQEAKHG